MAKAKPKNEISSIESIPIVRCLDCKLLKLNDPDLIGVCSADGMPVYKRRLTRCIRYQGETEPNLIPRNSGVLPEVAPAPQQPIILEPVQTSLF